MMKDANHITDGNVTAKGKAMFASRHTADFTIGRVAGFSGLARLVTHLRLARIARAQRRALSRLDTAALRDIGVTPDEVRTEVLRHAWDVPQSWRR
jgi:uncharacterized protein YjiS (DUF1127 family)